MHDKTVRRRRAVLALLVVLSLILISASFTSSGGGPLRAVQSGFLDVISPIETGADKVLTPVHDLFNWISDVSNASSQRDKLRKQLTALRAQFVKNQALWRESQDAARILGLLRRDNLTADGPVGASVVIQPETLFVRTIQIDAGSGAGVRPGDPVLGDQGLVGTVASVAAGTSSVTLIDDNATTEAAVDNANGELGFISADPGTPSLLQMTNVADPTKVKLGDFIVTAGSRPTGGASLIPPDIPIGTVTSAPPASDTLAAFTITPTVDFGALGAVVVLTKVTG